MIKFWSWIAPANSEPLDPLSNLLFNEHMTKKWNKNEPRILKSMLYKLILYAIVVKAIEDYSDYYSDIIEKMTDSGNNTVRRVKVSVHGLSFLGFEFHNESRFWDFRDLDHGIPRTLFRTPTPAGYNETFTPLLQARATYICCRLQRKRCNLIECDFTDFFEWNGYYIAEIWQLSGS